MNKLFFDHLININRLQTRLQELELAKEEIEELEESIDELLQHRVIEVILDNLSPTEHHTFISWIHTNPADTKLFEWLKSEIHDIEDQIQTAIAESETELINELFEDQTN